MTRLISTILLIMMPLQLIADDLPKITPLQKNQSAPYSGVLYNSTAVADAIAQREALIAQHKLNLEILEDQLKAQCNLQLENLSAELDQCQDQYNQMLGIKDKQIGQMQELLLDAPNNHTHWWFAGGVLLGVVTTVGVFYVVK